MYERLVKNKEIDATAYDGTNYNKTSAFKKEDVKQSLKGTIKLLENSIGDCKSEINESKNKDHIYGEVQGYKNAIDAIKEMHPAINLEEK